MLVLIYKNNLDHLLIVKLLCQPYNMGNHITGRLVYTLLLITHIKLDFYRHHL